MFRLVLRLAPLLLVAVLVVGCGNKGDLVKPAPKTTAPSASLH